MCELIVREQYFATCSRDLEIFLRERKVRDLDEMVMLAEQYLEAHRSKTSNWMRSQREETSNETEMTPTQKEELDSKKPLFAKDGRKHCWHCDSVKHLGKDCPHRPRRKTMAMRNWDRDSDGSSQEDREGAAAMNVGNQDNNNWRFNRDRRQYNYPPQRNEEKLESKVNEKYVCKLHNKEKCPECFTLIPEHSCSAMLMQSGFCELKCGCRIPVVTDACRINTHGKVPVSTGKINGKEVTVMRDTGCTTVVVKRDLVNESQLTGAQQKCVLIDGTIRIVPVARIQIETEYFSGNIEAVCMINPLYDLILGNIPEVLKDNGPRLSTVTFQKKSVDATTAGHVETPKEELVQNQAASVTCSMSTIEIVGGCLQGSVDESYKDKIKDEIREIMTTTDEERERINKKALIKVNKPITYMNDDACPSAAEYQLKEVDERINVKEGWSNNLTEHLSKTIPSGRVISVDQLPDARKRNSGDLMRICCDHGVMVTVFDPGQRTSTQQLAFHTRSILRNW